MRALGHFVVTAGHVERLAGAQVIGGEIDRAAAIVLRTFGGIGNVGVAGFEPFAGSATYRWSSGGVPSQNILVTYQGR